MAGPPARGLVLHAFLVLELVLAVLGVGGLLVELVATPAVERCTGPDDATFVYVSISSALAAVPLGVLVLLGLAALWARAEERVPWLPTEAVVTTAATLLGVLAVLGWFGVCSGNGPFG